VTNEDLIPYIHPLHAVNQALRFAEKTITYGEAAKAVGMWDGKGKYPRAFDRLINLTADTLNEHSEDYWQWLVNAATGKPGAGFYKK
jgi:hypothetical protein